MKRFVCIAALCAALLASVAYADNCCKTPVKTTAKHIVSAPVHATVKTAKVLTPGHAHAEPEAAEAALPPAPPMAAESLPPATDCDHGYCVCDCDGHPVAHFLARELIAKPAYGVKKAVLAAEARKLCRMENRLTEAACEADCVCEAQRIAEKRARLECLKANLVGEGRFQSRRATNPAASFIDTQVG